MIRFFSENDFNFKDKNIHKKWIKHVIAEEGCKIGDLNFIFCSDEYLLDINKKHLSHDFYTDIITFDYREYDSISGEIYISTDRVKDNAETNKIEFKTELKRVLIHGVLHILGYSDHSDNEIVTMRNKEDLYIDKYNMFHVKQ